MFKKGYIKLSNSIISVELDKYGEQYLYGDAGLNFEKIDNDIICTCEWLTINGQVLKGLKINETIE